MRHGTAPNALNRPVIILVGHSGSGKSEVAINLALAVRGRGDRAVLVDLDLVKPYFRSRLVRDLLVAEGVDVVVPHDDRLYADSPVIPPEVRRYLSLGHESATGSDATTVIVDVGGNDNGARVLGSLSGVLLPDRTDLLFVVNANRPLTGDLDAMGEMVQEVSIASGLQVTGLVSNTHLMDETTKEIVGAGLEAARALSERIDVPVRFFCVPELLSSSNSDNENERQGCPVLLLRRHILPPHARRVGSGHASVL